MRPGSIPGKNMGKTIRSLKLREDCLIVFAKEPRLGRVKTRLRTIFSDKQCLELYKAFLKDTDIIVRRASPSSLILAYDSLEAPPRYLKKIFKKYYFYKQEGANLGQRMHKAFAWAKQFGAQRIVIIGSDSPTLPEENIQNAFEALK